MQVSVIIPCYNAATTIATQLEALASQEWSEPWEVIVSNDGSTDDTLAIVEWYRKCVPNLRVINSSEQRGRSRARNIAAKAASGDALVFCDADDEVAPGWVATIGEALLKHDFVASRWETKKLNPPWLQWNSTQENRLQKAWYPPYLPHAAGSGLGVKRALHEAVGGFDESLPRLMDTDYCFKIQLTGAELRFVPDALYHYRYPGTYARNFHQARLWAHYNILLYKRYRPIGIEAPHPWREYARQWLCLLRLLPGIHDKMRRGQLVRSLGQQIGRLQGVIKHRVHPV